MEITKQCSNCGGFIESEYKEILGSGDFEEDGRVIEFMDYVCKCDAIVRVFEGEMGADLR